MYEPDNKVDPPQPKEIVLQNVLIGTLEILPQTISNFIDTSISNLSLILSPQLTGTLHLE